MRTLLLLLLMFISSCSVDNTKRVRVEDCGPLVGCKDVGVVFSVASDEQGRVSYFAQGAAAEVCPKMMEAGYVTGVETEYSDIYPDHKDPKCASLQVFKIMSVQAPTDSQLRACALYIGTATQGFPMPLQKCVDIAAEVECNQAVVDAESDSKVWRSYPESRCGDADIASGLSERYLLEGVD